MIVKRVMPRSAARLSAVMYGALGLMGGAMFFVMAVVERFGDAKSTACHHDPSLFLSASLLVLLPLGYGALGALLGWSLASLYNVAARRLGGIEIDVAS